MIPVTPPSVEWLLTVGGLLLLSIIWGTAHLPVGRCFLFRHREKVYSERAKKTGFRVKPKKARWVKTHLAS